MPCPNTYSFVFCFFFKGLTSRMNVLILCVLFKSCAVVAESWRKNTSFCNIANDNIRIKFLFQIEKSSDFGKLECIDRYKFPFLRFCCVIRSWLIHKVKVRVLYRGEPLNFYNFFSCMPVRVGGCACTSIRTQFLY